MSRKLILERHGIVIARMTERKRSVLGRNGRRKAGRLCRMRLSKSRNLGGRKEARLSIMLLRLMLNMFSKCL